MSDNDNGASGLGWFLAGLGVGALVGVLYAPKAGRELRGDIRERLRRAPDDLSEAVGSVVGREAGATSNKTTY